MCVQMTNTFVLTELIKLTFRLVHFDRIARHAA